MTHDYLTDLNQEQRRAVKHGVKDGSALDARPLLVIAGAGSRVTAGYLSMSSAETSDEHHQAVVVVSLLTDVSEPADAVADGGAEGAPIDRVANFAFCDFTNSR